MQSQYDKETFKNGNIYQIFTYVKNEDKDNTGNVSGMLLYAQTYEDKFDEEEHIISGNKIGIKALDLERDFSKIKEQLDLIANEFINT